MSQPKYSINERVMVRCHAGETGDSDSLYIDDCTVTRSKIIPANTISTIIEGVEIFNPRTSVFYMVSEYEAWIEQDFIFPYHPPGNSFEWQMHELDKPIKQPEPV